MGYEIKLDIFEGPLDLLLYLIKKNEIDIYHIPIALITEQYLEYIQMMRSFNLDLAGEYLVLASTLIHIKSRMLLPEEDDDREDEPDPRQELVKQLLEYQAFKEAAMHLGDRPVLERDVFKRGHPVEELFDKEEEKTAVEVSIFALVRAFQKIVSTLNKSEFIEIDVERISLADRISEVVERLAKEKSLIFTDLLGEHTERRKIVYTFLAILELMKLRMIRAYQMTPFGVIRIFLAENPALPVEKLCPLQERHGWKG